MSPRTTSKLTFPSTDSGKFWKSNIEFAPDAQQRFQTFTEPGFGKLTCSLRVDPRLGGGSWITFDLRVGASDKEAWRTFGRYWLLIGQFSHLIGPGGTASTPRSSAPSRRGATPGPSHSSRSASSDGPSGLATVG